jgi:hypothetical protein
MVWLLSRPTWLGTVRAALDRALGVTVRADPASQAHSWLTGTGDLLFAAERGQVPLSVRLGVLAHGDIRRLADLGRNCRRGSVRRAWGTEMARLAGEIAEQAGTAEALAAVQHTVLVPLELDSLAGHNAFTSAGDLIAYLRSRLSASEFQRSG